MLPEKEKQQYEKIFLDDYRQLNAAQREAVDTIEGPVLVIAGPGTGKTRLLANRLGKILMETQAAPENILCLTYTEAGVKAMRDKLRDLIGPDAHRLPIHTFHSFCHRVVTEHPQLFEADELEVLSDLERAEVIEEIIDNLPADNALFRGTGNRYADRDRLANLYHTIKDENWNIAEITRKTLAYIESLPENPDFQYKRKSGENQKGDPNLGRIEKKTKDMQRFLAALETFKIYRQKLRELNRYEFIDMIPWVLDAFDKHEWLLRLYQERYQYILVDEYQDTSTSQNQLLMQLASFWGDNPNLFVVGDDDQSIFRFQGANVENILAFYERYRNHVRVVVLTENYRSVQPVLDAAGRLIANNTQRLVKKIEDFQLSKDLVASNPDRKKLDIRPVVREYNSPLHETIAIARELKLLADRGEDLREVAVIYRQHSHAEELIQWLGKLEVPFRLAKSYNLLQSPFIGKIRMLMDYLASEAREPFSGESQLTRILLFDFFRIDPLFVARLAARKKATSNYDNWREYIAAVLGEPKPLFDGDARNLERLRQLFGLLEELLTAMDSYTLPQWFEKLVYEMGIVRYVMESPARMELMENLNGFFTFLKAEAERKPGLTLADFLETLRRLEQYRIRIEQSSLFSPENAVTLTTAHSAKGLEFRHVFVMRVNDDWEKGKNRSGNFPLPPFLKPDPEADIELEENRRLFYVAVTRAKEHLYISYPAANEKNKPQGASLFVTELRGDEIPVETPALPEEWILEYVEKRFRPVLLAGSAVESEGPVITLPEPEYLQALLKNYRLSVTHLDSLLSCPLSFYFNNLLRLPAPKSEAMEYGSAVHHALQVYFEEMRQNRQQFPPLERLIEHFERYMNAKRGNFSPQSFTGYLLRGRKSLTGYYNTHRDSWHTEVTLESNITVELDGMMLIGKLDKIEFYGNEVVIVDYKTGKPENIRTYNKLNRPDEKINSQTRPYVQQYGGDYWRQAVFYKILFELNKPLFSVREVYFDMIDPDKKGIHHRKVVEITSDDVEALQQQISYAWQRIMALDFTKGCGEPDCAWCNLVNENFLSVPEVQTGVLPD